MMYYFSLRTKMEYMRLMSYNCHSFNSNLNIICSLLSSCDILCLQETLICDENSHLYDNLDYNFISSYAPATRKNDVTSGRSSGGLAIFWRKSKDFECFPVIFSDRIMGVKISFGNITYLVLNIYCICDYGNSESL